MDWLKQAKSSGMNYREAIEFYNKDNSPEVIEDNNGQWSHPGEITKINSPNITMRGVNYPVIGVSDTGHTQMMYPNKDYKFEGNSVTEYPQKFQYGGPKSGLYNTDKTKWVDSVNTANSNLDFVKRYYDNSLGDIQIPGEPGRSTHYMTSSDKRVYPTVVNINGKLQYFPNWRDADAYARKTKEYIEFPTEEQARWYAENGYKQGTGVLKTYQNGGTATDSLNVYNNSLELKGFYDKLKPYYKEPDIQKDNGYGIGYTDEDFNEIESKTLANRDKEHGISDASAVTIYNNKDKNILYFSDLVTPQIDPKAPLMRYDRRIKPNGLITYYPKRALFDVINYKRGIKDLNDYSPENQEKLKVSNKIVDYIQYPNSYPEGKKDTEDFIKTSGLSMDVLKVLSRQELENSKKLPGNITTIPYYDPKDVKPWFLRTDEEKKDFVKRHPEKYITQQVPTNRTVQRSFGLQQTLTPKPTIPDSVKQVLKNDTLLYPVKENNKPIPTNPPITKQQAENIPISKGYTGNTYGWKQVNYQSTPLYWFDNGKTRQYMNEKEWKEQKMGKYPIQQF